MSTVMRQVKVARHTAGSTGFIADRWKACPLLCDVTCYVLESILFVYPVSGFVMLKIFVTSTATVDLKE